MKNRKNEKHVMQTQRLPVDRKVNKERSRFRITQLLIFIFIACLLSSCAMVPHQEGEGTVSVMSEQQPVLDNRSSSETGVSETGRLSTSAIPSSAPFDEATKSGKLQVHYIDVGQGASQLLIGPTGKVMLIDAGNNDKEALMVDYLKEQGISTIHILIGTHPDADHIGGLDAVIDHFHIDKLYMPRIQANTKTFEDVLRAVQNKGIKISTAKAGIELEWESDIEVKMIAPINEYRETNEMSAVVHLTYGETSFLFTGDAEAKSEYDLIQSGVNLRADVLLVGHHGSHSSTSRAFLDQVNPTYGVIQVGENNYGHPGSEVLNRLNDKGIHIYRNDEHGTIVFISNGTEIDVTQNRWTYQPSKASGPKAMGEMARPIVPAERDVLQAATSDVDGELFITALIDNAAPSQNSTVSVTAKVTDHDGNSIPNADVHLELHYKSTKTVYEGKTDDHGTATLSFKIGRATKEFQVNGDLTVTYGDRSGQAQVSFTPQ